MKVGDRVTFKKKVYKKPYTPYYDKYKRHEFEIVKFHYDEESYIEPHIELKCLTGRIKMGGYVHPDEIKKVSYGRPR